MIKIGGGWIKQSQKSNKEYLSLGIAKELLPLTITSEQYLTLHTNENKTDEHHPDYNLCLSTAEDEKK